MVHRPFLIRRSRLPAPHLAHLPAVVVADRVASPNQPVRVGAGARAPATVVSGQDPARQRGPVPPRLVYGQVAWTRLVVSVGIGLEA